MALCYSGITVELREVVLRDKPQEMLDCSAKGTVPVLVLTDGTVIDESLDIMLWALNKNDPDNWLKNSADKPAAEVLNLVQENDGAFKYWLDRYKYADRYPENPPDYYRSKGERFLKALEERLRDSNFIFGDNPDFADIATFPFVRQFANTDADWFYSADYRHLQRWLDHLLSNDLFTRVMGKYKAWNAGDAPTLFGNTIEA